MFEFTYTKNKSRTERETKGTRKEKNKERKGLRRRWAEGAMRGRGAAGELNR